MSSIRCCKHKIFQLFALSCCVGKALFLKWVKLSFWPFICPGLWTRLSQVKRLLLWESFTQRASDSAHDTELKWKKNLGILCSQPHLALQLNCFPGIYYVTVSGQRRLTSKKNIRLWIKWEAFSFEEYRINSLTREKLASYQDNTGIQWTPLGTKTHQYGKWFLIWWMIIWT